MCVVISVISVRVCIYSLGSIQYRLEFFYEVFFLLFEVIFQSSILALFQNIYCYIGIGVKTLLVLNFLVI